ncbi:nitrite reductase [NAD(P)H] large subunit [Buttiauxella brennerae ATCC 51605]|uniref:Nitrite reductase [NAD(P)H] large subunit n=1 Tax=Buttiauxella brennerae ATCC 51605 TaxID=1354251 RepID=A0A1B7ISL2_9ENTR|nr:nitrite reductase large subunit NirB [Buttiauxella brennerae]OAT32810.1 nitrite reductase [NAD(P)H] large subunit [Buttiauxella brennerae ATCC 51605]
MKQRLIVIGNGMAAIRLVEQIVVRAAGRFSITLFGEEPALSYNRILLSPVLAGEKPASATQLHTAAWYRAHDIELLTAEAVLDVDTKRQIVRSAKRALEYDELVFATGSRPFIPPIDGHTLPHVHGFRTLADVDAILGGEGDAVVLGGGLLGVEAAAALCARGIPVTLVHRQPWLMDIQLNQQAGVLLEQHLAARGIACQLSCGIERINADSVLLSHGDVLPAGRVVIATGVKPNISLAQQAGLDCTRGITVDAQLRSATPHVSALGECCEIDGQTWGLVAPCLQQADVLAARLCGEISDDFHYLDRGTRLKVSGIPLFSAGEIREQPDSRVLTAFDPLTKHYRCLHLRGDRLVGALLLGDITPANALTDILLNAAPVTPGVLFDEYHSDEQPPAAGNDDMTKETLVVIGHGMVGHHFLEKCVALQLHKRYHIVVFGEERYPAYDRVHLSEYFAGRSADSLSMVQGDFFNEYGIELRCNSKIVAVDRQQRLVRDNDGRETYWDKLVLATGSFPFVPPVPGNDLAGCFVYRTLDDLDAIAQRARNATRGVVIGGGLLGLEAANALKQLGLETHVVEFAPNLMAVQLDNSGAAMLREKISDIGVQVHTSKATTAITDADGLQLNFADGETLSTDLIVFSAGIRPQDALAKTCDLALGERGGVVINDQCQTSDNAIYAIGECALWEGRIFGLVAPGYQMARVTAATLAGQETAFRGADMSTKLKLLGIDVASFGDAHGRTPGSQSYQWTNGPQQIYKKIVVSADNKTLLGGVLVGDSQEYATLLQMMLNGMALPAQPESLILPASAGGAPKGLGVAALPDSAQICSCHNVSKADICSAVSNGAGDMGAIKTCTKAATGCGGCSALVKQVMEYQLQEQGVEVKKDICEHFPFSRQEIYHLVRVNHIHSFEQLISRYGHGHGCEICKPLAASVLASCWNEYLLKPAHLPLQDTNDRYFANIQKDGTYSIVPRVPAGEITPDGLIAIGQVAKRYQLYSKITGGQRIDLFGARLEELPAIWEELVAAGFETGHAYGKSLRTVKSCVGSTWCRYGVQDSTGLAIELENRYKGLRSPHKIKMAVSGCTRECAEAQSKDIGVIATDKGWNLYVCGNGGMKPRHADLFASDLDRETLIRIIDCLLMFYIRTADRLQRTSTWMDNLEGGIEYLRDVILNDSLGLADELEKEMVAVVDTYQCEWQTTLNSPDRLALFRSYVNSEQPDEAVQRQTLRGQLQPVNEVVQHQAVVPVKPWHAVCDISAIPLQAGIGARLGELQIALFRFGDTIYALDNLEPGSDANVLSRGIVGDASGEPIVISPLYKHRIRLRDGRTQDGEQAVRAWPVKVEQGTVWVGSQALILRAEAS